MILQHRLMFLFSEFLCTLMGCVFTGNRKDGTVVNFSFKSFLLFAQIIFCLKIINFNYIEIMPCNPRRNFFACRQCFLFYLAAWKCIHMKSVNWFEYTFCLRLLKQENSFAHCWAWIGKINANVTDRHDQKQETKINDISGFDEVSSGFLSWKLEVQCLCLLMTIRP